MRGIIEATSVREVQTKNGPSKRLGFKINGTWYNAWAHAWNSKWAKGMTVDIPNERITEKTFNGKTNFDISSPPTSKEFQQQKLNYMGEDKAPPDNLRALEARIDRLELTVSKLEAKLVFSQDNPL